MLCVSGTLGGVPLHESRGKFQPPGDARHPVPPYTAAESELYVASVSAFCDCRREMDHCLLQKLMNRFACLPSNRKVPSQGHVVPGVCWSHSHVILGMRPV